ncbi:MAG: hypothetical protein U0002_05955 [Thermoanaerobaculia bacterium]
MRRIHRCLGLALLALALVSCHQRTDKDKGGVLLTISSFDGLAPRVSVNQAGGIVQLGRITLENFPKDPAAATSNLEDIELRSFEVVYTRADAGTRVPPARVRGFLGNVPVNGNDIVVNLDILGVDQFANPPLSDLLFENGGFDKETGARSVQLNLALRFFGRTISGDTIASNTARMTIEFVP